MSIQISRHLDAQPGGFMEFTNLDMAIKACNLIASSNFCPKEFRGKTGDVLCAIQYGMEIGLSPMQAIQSIAVINGKPSIYGDGLIGLCLAFPECEDIQETFDEATITAICKVKRKGMSEVISTYSKQDAIEAKLWGKPGPWTQYWKRMLKMRARSFALRDAFADRLKGIITAEEARDYPPREEKPINIVTSINKNVPQETSHEIEQKVCKDTGNHLKFLVAQCEIPQVTISKWFKKANIARFEDFSEEQAVKIIGHLESNNFEAKQAWVDFMEAQEAYNQEQTEGVMANG